MDDLHGTYRIQSPGYYCIKEDIVFNPNPCDFNAPNAENCYFPQNFNNYPGFNDLINGAFANGFFTMISIESNNVTLDLNNKELKMSFDFYIQQRFFSIIEIANSPFEQGIGPNNYGINVYAKNVIVKNGYLGLSSHHGIHSNGAINVLLKDLNIYDFEVAGIQLNGFNGLEINRCNIGPSHNNVPILGYYSNARFLITAFYKLFKEHYNEVYDKFFTFGKNTPKERKLSVLQIFNNLIESMDIAFRISMDVTNKNDLKSKLYEISKKLYINNNQIPDGSAMYGIVLFSWGIAVHGFGGQGFDKFKNEAGNGENAVIKNTKIHNLRLSVNEIPALLNLDSNKVNMGPFGDMIDFRKTVDTKYWDLVDEDNYDEFLKLDYSGNPLSDAQIIFCYLRKLINKNNNNNNNILYGSTCELSENFEQWVFEGKALDFVNKFRVVCNGDVMFHTNKGIVGIRIDYIENVELSHITMSELFNESPLCSYACKNYRGPKDGGNGGDMEDEGGMSTDVRGIGICGSDSLINNRIEIKNLVSNYGDVIGIDILPNTVFLMSDGCQSNLRINNLIGGNKISKELLLDLKKNGKYPYPNNVFNCNVRISDDNAILSPLPPDLNINGNIIQNCSFIMR